MVGGEKSPSRLIHIVGRIPFHVTIGWRILFPCWLSARGHSQLLGEGDRKAVLKHLMECTMEESLYWFWRMLEQQSLNSSFH